MAKNSIILTSSAIQALVSHPLSKSENMVLWLLVENVPASGMVVSHADLANKLKLTRPSVSQTMKRLCEIGFLVRGPKIGVSHHYKINPVFIRILN